MMPSPRLEWSKSEYVLGRRSGARPSQTDNHHDMMMPDSDLGITGMASLVSDTDSAAKILVDLDATVT